MVGVLLFVSNACAAGIPINPAMAIAVASFFMAIPPKQSR
jgi:hypothetical protein